MPSLPSWVIPRREERDCGSVKEAGFDRKELWGKWWEYFIDFAQTVPLYELENVYALDASFNWEPRADGWMTFRELTPAK